MKYISFLILLSATAFLAAQELGAGRISGSFQTDAQYYFPDSIINASTVPERLASNTFLQLTYQNGPFSAGGRFEAYLPPLLGFRAEYDDLGIPYRFARYAGDKLDITVGNFYEQFGTGMVLRTYQEWTLGIDNSLDGVRVALRPGKGLYLTGLLGRQRKFWDVSRGLVRAGNADWFVHEAFPNLIEKGWQLSVGGSVVNRFLEDENPDLRLPENVSAFAGRFSVLKSGFRLDGEYAYRINDPFNKNNFVYNSGSGIYLNASYTRKGLGITASLKRIDNLDFRSERNVFIEELTINFLPPTTLQHTYRLPTLYPYATQPNGEFGAQVDVIYKIPRGTALGGKYGTQLLINFAQINGLDTAYNEDGFTYTSSFFGDPQKLYFRDINFEIAHRWSRSWKSSFNYIYLHYNKSVIEFGRPGASVDSVQVHAAILENQFKLKRRQSLRTELQLMLTQNRTDLGHWAMGLVELALAPHWYIGVFDEWNFGNPNPARRAHYYNVNAAYVTGGSRIALAYGRQRAGLLCVGGICRVVPAANGFTLSVNTTF